MKLKTIYLTLILSITFNLIFNIIPFNVSAKTGTTGIFSYSVTDNKATITKCSYAIGRVKVPAAIGGYNVTAIGYQSFADCTSLTDVILPSTVTVIGDSAFSGCTALESVNISSNVTFIGENAFYNTAFLNNSADVVDGVTYIGNCLIKAASDVSGRLVIKDGTKFIAKNAFAGCTEALEVVIPESMVEISQYAFSDCKGLTSVEIPDSVLVIGNSAFSSSGLKNITIPNSVTLIDEYAFSRTAVSSIDIPQSVNKIGTNAFYVCQNLSTINIADNVNEIGSSAFYATPYYDNTENWDGKVLYIGKYLISAKTDISGNYTVKDGTTVLAANSFISCTNLISVTLPEGIKTIGYASFNGCKNLKKVNLPNSVTTLGAYAFNGCTNYVLESIPGGLTEINPYTFYNCDCVDDIYIPSSVKKIGDYAFYRCQMKTLYIGDGVTDIGDYAFDQTYTEVLHISCNLKTIGVRAFYNCNGSDLLLPEGLLSIGDDAFAGSGFKYISIPSSISYFGIRAFERCNNLTAVNLADGLSMIGSDAFYHCDKLANINIPKSVSSIGGSAFAFTADYSDDSNWDNGVLYLGDWLLASHYENLLSLNVREGTKHIASGALESCIYLKEVTMPESVKHIGDRAFYNCKALETVNLPSDLQMIGKEAFKNTAFYSNTANWENNCLYIGNCFISAKEKFSGSCLIKDGTLCIANEACLNRGNITEITIPNCVKYIGDYSFSGCNLKKAVIPTALYEIGSNAFSNNPHLEKVTISDNIKKINESAFANCYNLNKIFYNSGEEEWNSISVAPKNQEIYEAVLYYNWGPVATPHSVLKDTAYNTKKYQAAPANLFTQAKIKWEIAQQYYLETVKSRCDEMSRANSDTDPIEIAAAKLMENDSKTNDKFLTINPLFPKEDSIYCYKALYKMLDTCKTKTLTLENIKTGDAAKLAKKVVDAVKSSYSDINYEAKFDKYTITFTGMSFGSGSFSSMECRNKKTGKSYISYQGTTLFEMRKLTADYIDQLKELELNTVECALSEYVKVLDEFIGYTSVKNAAVKKAANKINSFLKDKGLGDVNTALGNCITYRGYVSKITDDVSDKDLIKSAETILSASPDAVFTDETVTDVAVKKALSKLNAATDNLKSAARDYLTGKGIDPKEPEEENGFLSFLKFTWKCPVDITVYDNYGKTVASINGNDAASCGSLNLSVDGDVKTLICPYYSSYTVKVKGTDYGKLCYTVEQFKDGASVGKLNYYDIEIDPQTVLNSSIYTGNIKDGVNNVSLKNNGVIAGEYEYLVPTDDGKVTINCNVDGNGTVSGKDDYIKGDSVTLCATPDDGFAFAGWYGNGEFLTGESVYQFTAKDDLNIDARFVSMNTFMPDLDITVCEPFTDKLSVNGKQDSTDLSVNVNLLDNSVNPDEIKLYIAAYNDNRLVSVKEIDGNIDGLKKSFYCDSPSGDYKILMWNNNLMPVILPNQEQLD